MSDGVAVRRGRGAGPPPRDSGNGLRTSGSEVPRMAGRNGTRVVVTGMGALTPLGNSVSEFWQGCLEGRSGIDYVTQFDATGYPSKVAGEVKGFDPLDHMDRRDARRMSRFSQFAVAAGRQSIQAAELDMEREDPSRVGVVLGNGIGGLPNIEAAVHTIRDKGGMRIDPFFMPKMLPNMAGGGARRRFDADRDGFVAAEGAAIFVFESLERAQRRDAPIIAEIAGYGACNDAYHVVAPCADGEGAIRAMNWAMEDAGVTPDQVDYINAHGTGTKLNDSAETFAIKKAFGELAYRIPVSATKSMVGHSFGAAGAVESVATLESLRQGVIPPTINYETPDPECDLDSVPNRPRRADVRVALKNSFGFGGQNACLLFKRFPD